MGRLHGCGHELDCGGCTGGATCDPVKHICLAPNCTGNTSCKASGVTYCGTIGDGCGGSLDCGASCPNGQACGQVAANVCGNAKPCTNLCLKQTTCSGGATTSVSGTVFAPTPPKFGLPERLS